MHHDTLSFPQLPPGHTDHRRTTGQTELFEDGHRRRYGRSSRNNLGGTTGRMEQRADNVIQRLLRMRGQRQERVKKCAIPPTPIMPTTSQIKALARSTGQVSARLPSTGSPSQVKRDPTTFKSSSKGVKAAAYYGSNVQDSTRVSIAHDSCDGIDYL